MGEPSFQLVRQKRQSQLLRIADHSETLTIRDPIQKGTRHLL